MENKTINIAIVEKVASALKELKKEMVFVGGAVISLYTDDPAADEIRPTQDIDMTINLQGFGAWVKMQERLSELGFHPNPEGHAICSYTYQDVLIDIMPSEDGPIGPANPWYQPGFSYLIEMVVQNEKINILSAPYFLATKFSAFADRGKDYRTSHDFEDIIYVLDNRISIVEEIKGADETVRNFLVERFKEIKTHLQYEEIISAQIHPLMAAERLPIVLRKIEQVTLL
ncbi:MAG: nucleotidyl transferase AbiEii/AbiGii toxin family protein [Bacteroidia bacterium]